MIKNLACRQCGAPLPAPRVSVAVTCGYCGASSFVAYDFDHDAVRLVRQQVDLQDMREKLAQRIEILASNLNSIDPASQWGEAGPELPAGKFGPAFAVGGAGMLLFLHHPAWGILVLLGVVLAGGVLSRHSQLKELWERDRIISSRNGPLIFKLRGEFETYVDICRQIDEQLSDA